jgi:VPDSG-CTERM motif
VKVTQSNNQTNTEKNMKNKLIIMAATVAALASFNAQATPITGSIGFYGAYTSNGNPNDLSTGTLLTLNSPAIFGATSQFTGASLVSFAPSAGINANSSSLIGSQLWSVLVGSTTYTFLVGSEVQTLGAFNTTLTLAGFGTIGDGTAADNTSGTWTLGFGASGETFNWIATSANVPATVPDGGTTVALLGGALAGLGLLKRKFLA